MAHAPSAGALLDERSTERALLSVVSAAAAAIHFAVIGDHFSELWLFGVFFLVVAWFQVAWAVLVMRYVDRRLFLVGALANGAIVAVWLWSRTFGLPFGPEAGQPEDVVLIDVMATVLEVVLVAGCIMLLSSRRPLGMVSGRGAAALLVLAALLTVGATSWALVDSSGEDAHHGGTEEQPTEEHPEHEEEGLGSKEISTVPLAQGAKLQAFVSGIAAGKKPAAYMTFVDSDGDEWQV